MKFVYSIVISPKVTSLMYNHGYDAERDIIICLMEHYRYPGYRGQRYITLDSDLKDRNEFKKIVEDFDDFLHMLYDESLWFYPCLTYIQFRMRTPEDKTMALMLANPTEVLA